MTVPLVLGGRPYPPVPVLAQVLTSVLATVTAAEGEPPEQVVLTCPAVWGPVRRQQFSEVSRRAGLSSVAVVSEPEAAVTALVDTRRLVEDDVVLVYDLGGVSADMTVVRVTSTGVEILGLPEGAEGAGGGDFDDRVLMHVDHAVGGALSGLDLTDPVAVGVLAGVRAECIRAKEALSRIEIASIRVVGFAQEIAPVRLTRPEFEGLIEDALIATLPGLHRVLSSAGVEPSALTGVLLVGGSSRIPLLASMLHDELGCPILVDDHPQHCVALGAAAIAGGTTSHSDGALEITPGAPPVTNAIPVIVSRDRPPRQSRPSARSVEPQLLTAVATSPNSTFYAVPAGELAVTDSGAPLPQRAGGHRMPRMGDWRRRAGLEWDLLLDRPWRMIAIGVLTVMLIIGGMYVYSPGAARPAAGSALDNQIINIVPESVVTPTRSRPISDSDATPTTSPKPATDPAADTSGKGSSGDGATPKPSPSKKPKSKPKPTKTKRPAPTKAPVKVTGQGVLVGFAGKCLDVKEGATDDGTPIQLFECNGATAQDWTTYSDGSLQALGKCMQVADVGRRQLRIELSTCNGGDTQRWLVSAGAIINTDLNRCVDVLWNNGMNRTPVTIADCTGAAGQSWEWRS